MKKLREITLSEARDVLYHIRKNSDGSFHSEHSKLKDAKTKLSSLKNRHQYHISDVDKKGNSTYAWDHKGRRDRISD